MSNAMPAHAPNISPNISCNVNDFLNNITGPQLLVTSLLPCPAPTAFGSTLLPIASGGAMSLYGPSLGDYVAGRGWEAATQAFHDNSLISIAEHCGASKALEAGSSFIGMVNKIQFRAKVENIRCKLGTSAKDACAQQLKGKYKRSTLEGWLSEGSKFAHLAAAGTIYILMVIAAMEEKKCNANRSKNCKLPHSYNYPPEEYIPHVFLVNVLL
ncbi:hypothetical protein L208DRAFT_1380894 [Tricholoma matsutake]|nr:hypothetical protein L208DRAFT_1380894 [Tricholoma matsutake 945]